MSSKRRLWLSRTLFLVAGLAFALLMLWLSAYRWRSENTFLLSLHSYSTWIAMGVIVLLRLVRGRAIKAVSFIVGLWLPYFALMFFLFGWPVLEDHWHRQEFDAVAWRAEVPPDEWEWPPRLRMVDDLMESGRLEGLTADAVVELLGPGDPVHPDDWDFCYYLGPERGFVGIDSETLVVELGDDGFVERYWIHTD